MGSNGISGRIHRSNKDGSFMEVTQVSKEGELHTLDVELSPDEVNQEFNRAFNRHRKSLVVPGFRKGKAPKGAVRRRFGSKIQQEVRDTLLNAYSLLAMDMRNMNLIDRPKVEALVPLEENKPFSFRLRTRANVVPEVRGYDGLRIRIPPRRKVTDEDINEVIDRLRKRYATLRPAEGPNVEVCVTDRITVDAAFLGHENDEVLISAPDELLEVLSAETMLYGLKLVGRKPDEETIADYLKNWQQAQSARLKHLQFQLTASQSEVVDEALARILPQASQNRGESPNTRGTALFLLCKFYLERENRT